MGHERSKLFNHWMLRFPGSQIVSQALQWLCCVLGLFKLREATACVRWNA